MKRYVAWLCRPLERDSTSLPEPTTRPARPGNATPRIVPFCMGMRQSRTIRRAGSLYLMGH